MIETLSIFLTAVFVNNFVMVQFLGLCPFMGASQKLDNAIGMSLATIFVLTLAAGLSYLVNQYLLAPLNLEFLRIIAFIVIIAAIVQFAEMMIRSSHPVLHRSLGLFIPLITTNCAVLGVALLLVSKPYGFVTALFYGLGAACGFALVLLIFSAMRERLDQADIPAVFSGTAIHMITAALLSLAFMGFTGMGVHQ